ncbi:MAG TPA: hypothetical protein VEH76_08965 [Methylocystis sp.]|nr:hypothetical protein [Methylocystis sp.]
MKIERALRFSLAAGALASLTISQAHAAVQYCGFRPCPNQGGGTVPQGSCQASNALTVLVRGSNVTGYVPHGYWNGGRTGVGVINIEGSSVTPASISTPNIVNSCAANAATGQTVCTANNTDVYLLAGTSLSKTLTSGGSGTIGFSGGECTNCSVAMDAVHNKALIGMSTSNGAGFQYLDLGTTTFESPFASQSSPKEISENILIDPNRNLILSPSEADNYEVINVSNTMSPSFFEFKLPSSFTGEADSAAEDCSTGIALASGEFSDPSQVYVADLSQAKYTSGSPGSWSAPGQTFTLTESSLAAGACGLAVAQGTHTGVVTGEFGGNELTAISLPTTSGSGTPTIVDWVSCGLPDGFQMGFDPHTVTAYQSPNGSQHAFAVIANGTANQVAVVDLTLMLESSVVARTSGPSGGHACTSGTLPSTVVSFITVP